MAYALVAPGFRAGRFDAKTSRPQITQIFADWDRLESKHHPDSQEVEYSEVQLFEFLIL
jgi:hypothetical protein